MFSIYIGYMTLVVKKIKTQGKNNYYKPVNAKRVNGKIVQKYVGYPGKDPKSEAEAIAIIKHYKYGGFLQQETCSLRFFQNNFFYTVI